MSESAKPQTATLLVSCPDQRGIVAALAQVLYGHGANILDADQHTDAVAGIFFQRIHFDTSELRTDRTSLEAAIGEVAARLRMTWRLCDSARRKRMGRSPDDARPGRTKRMPNRDRTTVHVDDVRIHVGP